MNLKEQIKAWGSNKSRFLVRDYLAIGITSSLKNIIEIIEMHGENLTFDVNRLVWKGGINFEVSSAPEYLARETFGRVDIIIDAAGWECKGVGEGDYSFLGVDVCGDILLEKSYSELGENNPEELSEFLNYSPRIKVINFCENDYYFSESKEKVLAEEYSSFLKDLVSPEEPGL